VCLICIVGPIEEVGFIACESSILFFLFFFFLFFLLFLLLLLGLLVLLVLFPTKISIVVIVATTTTSVIISSCTAPAVASSGIAAITTSVVAILGIAFVARVEPFRLLRFLRRLFGSLATGLYGRGVS